MIDQEESEKCEKYGVIHEIQTSLINRADGKTSVSPIKPNYGPVISHSNPHFYTNGVKNTTTS